MSDPFDIAWQAVDSAHSSEDFRPKLKKEMELRCALVEATADWLAEQGFPDAAQRMRDLLMPTVGY